MIIVVLIVLGLCAGSFVNALIWRIHEQSKTSKKQPELSIVHGRSMCPHCQHVLSAKDLIPLFSWLSLGGKCRYCHKKIDDNPMVEIISPILFIVSYIYWPATFTTHQVVLFIFWLIMLVGLIALAIYDLKWYILPNQIVYTLFGLASLQVLWLLVDGGGRHVLSEAAFGFLIGGGLFYLLFQVSNGKWIGGGDVKLGALLGIIIGGPVASLLMLFLASLFGSLVSIPLLLTGKAKRGTRLPFGPFLILAAIVLRLFSASIIVWYKRQYFIV